MAHSSIAASLLVLENVSFQIPIDPEPILHAISFNLRSGEVLAIVGGAESGKTTLLRLLNRLQERTQGNITFKQRSLTQWPAIDLRRQIVMLPQEPKLLGMTVREAIVYPLRLQNISNPKLAEQQMRLELDRALNDWQIPVEWLDRTELQLSAGQRQIVAIARALTLKPAILLLDEPTTYLTLEQSNQLIKQLQHLCRSQTFSIIITTQKIPLAKQICTRLLYLQQGKLVCDRPASQINWSELTKEVNQDTIQYHQIWE